MKLRFEVDQAECFRNGIDCPKSIVTLDIDPQTLPQKDRNLIADRLSGIDICLLRIGVRGAEKILQPPSPEDSQAGKSGRPVHIKAKAPTFEALMDAIRENQREMEKMYTDYDINTSVITKTVMAQRAAALKQGKLQQGN